MSKVSIAIPYHQTPKTAFYLSRLLQSLSEQSFQDYEIVLTAEGKFAENHNAAIKKSTGEIIKIMQMDDYFSNADALKNIVESFDKEPNKNWLISGTLHTDGSTHDPMWTDDIYTGNNRLGSVSTIAFRREHTLLFEEPLTWVVDCDWYYRMYLKNGEPILSKTYDIVVDTRTDRLSHTLSVVLKLSEIKYLKDKYGK